MDNGRAQSIAQDFVQALESQGLPLSASAEDFARHHRGQQAMATTLDAESDFIAQRKNQAEVIEKAKARAQEVLDNPHEHPAKKAMAHIMIEELDKVQEALPVFSWQRKDNYYVEKQPRAKGYVFTAKEKEDALKSAQALEERLREKQQERRSRRENEQKGR